jgi:hypothetical protein
VVSGLLSGGWRPLSYFSSLKVEDPVLEWGSLKAGLGDSDRDEVKVQLRVAEWSPVLLTGKVSYSPSDFLYVACGS